MLVCLRHCHPEPSAARRRICFSQFPAVGAGGGTVMSRSIRYEIPPSTEITPRSVYMNRRAFLRAAGLFGAGAALAACSPRPTATTAPGLEPSAGAATDEIGDPLTP